MSLWYARNRNTISLMAVAKKVLLEYKLDPSTKLAEFVQWYELANTSTNENGRKRKGDAKKAIRLYLESIITGVKTKDYNDFMNDVDKFVEDNKLPKELQAAKNNLPLEEYESYKKLFEKIKKEEEKVKSI